MRPANPSVSLWADACAMIERAERLQEKADVYIDTSRGYAGALAWAWQPGNTLDECVTGNLADDLPVQAVMRDTGAE